MAMSTIRVKNLKEVRRRAPRAWLGPLTSALVLWSAAVVAAQTEVELTFDDGPDGSGPADGRAVVDNLETATRDFGAGVLTATLVGTAARSSIDEGRYGRAADLVGGAGGVELAPWQPAPARVFFLWLRPRRVDAGGIVSQESSFDVRFEAGEIVLGAYRPTGEYVSVGTGAMWPDDGGFHHLTLQIDARGGGPVVTVVIDATASAPVEVGFVPRTSTAPLTLGDGYDGLLDEVLIRANPEPTLADRLDRDPTFCPGGLSCVEEVIHLTPRDFPHPVPVRFKSIYDEAVCTTTSPCPVLFEVSGGNTCADDYSTGPAITALVEAGFVVVTVDLYCEGGDGTRVFPQETSQMVAVKDYVLSMGAVRDRISGPDYLASGCSHGAGTVAQWAMREVDHPFRTYSRSNDVDGLCGFFADDLCDMVRETGLARIGVASIEEVDLEDPMLREAHERGDLVGAITREIASSRDIARSWGANDTGRVCAADGNFICDEVGLYGVTYASRRYRDVWERAQPVDAPTGYFVEDHQRNCQHCALPSSEAFRCGVCLLRVGRAGMEAECPECLTYDDPTIERGPPGELCPMPASWYVDPLAATDLDAGGAGDAGVPLDATTSMDAGPREARGAGCGCVVVDRAAGATPALWALVAFALRLRTRRRTD